MAEVSDVARRLADLRGRDLRCRDRARPFRDLVGSSPLPGFAEDLYTAG